MAKIEFAGVSSEDSDNPSGETQRLLNCYPEPLGYRSRLIFKSVLGMNDPVATGDYNVRAMLPVRGTLYACSGSSFVRLNKAGTVTNLGTIRDSAQTSMAGLDGQPLVCAGGAFYSLSGGDVTAISDGRFTQYGSVTTLGQRAILTQRNGREFQWSDLVDPTSFPGLNFATADARDDNLLRAEVINGNLWLFGERSIEIWYQTGGAGAEAFTRLSGGVIDTGLNEFGLLAAFDGGAFFVGDDGIAYITTGAALQPVSVPALETALAYGEPETCFYYEDEGHKFCVIRFADRPAWVYDLSMKIWHERSSGVDHDPWTAVSSAEAYGKKFVGDFLGNISELRRTNADGDTPLKRTLVSKTLTQGGERFRVPKLELYSNPAGVPVAIPASSGCPALFQMQASSGDVDEGQYELDVGWYTDQQNYNGEAPGSPTTPTPTGSRIVGDAFTFGDLSTDPNTQYFIESEATTTVDALPTFSLELWGVTFEDPGEEFLPLGGDRHLFELYGDNVTGGAGHTSRIGLVYESDQEVYFYIQTGDSFPVDYFSLSTGADAIEIGSATEYYIGVFYKYATEEWELYIGEDGAAAQKIDTTYYTDTGNFPAFPSQADIGSEQYLVGIGIINSQFYDTNHFGEIKAVRFRECLPDGFDFGATYTPDTLPLDVVEEGASPLTYESGFRPPMVMARFSRDYGNTWGREEWRTMGDIGEYWNRIIWRNLGQQRQLTMEFSVTDPVEVPILGTGDIQVI